jgi:ABC-type branched-subunit amino acid transport system ATPase component/ABC-type branched-subunit amino acid transport system permease subunit
MAGGAAGFLLGLPAIRVRGIDLTVATLVFGIVIANTIFISPTFLGNNGFGGISVPRPTVFGLDVDPVVHPARFTILCLVILVIVGIGTANLRRSVAGRRMLAVRANERGAAALGISVGGAKVAAFALGGAVAGLAGSLTVFRTRSMTFGDFDVFKSIYALAFTVVSGVGYVAGAVYTGVVSTGGLISYLFRNMSSNVDLILAIISGVAVIQIMLQSPDGIIPLMSHQKATVAQRLGLNRVRRKIEPRAGHEPVARPKPAAGPDATATVDLPAPVDTEPREVVLRVDGIGVQYGSVKAVDQVSLEVREGQILGVIGPNGAGKSTLVDCLTGFVGQSSGSVRFGDENVGGWSIRRRARAGLGRTFQNLELFSDLTVRENLLAAQDRRHVGAYLSGWVRPGSTRLAGAATEAVALLGLDRWLDREISTLPQGTQRLVAVARALAAHPRVLCLDEPAAGLAQAERDARDRAIRRVARRLRVGVLLIEHNIDVVAGLCDQLIVLDFGKVVASGVPGEVLASEIVRRAYLGTADISEHVEPVTMAEEASS